MRFFPNLFTFYGTILVAMRFGSVWERVMTHKSNKQITQPTRDSRVDRAIDENLKRAFQKTAEEPLPQRFADLLDQLREGAGSSKDDAVE